MLQRILLGVLCVAFLIDGVHAQPTRMSVEEKIKELQRQMLDMQSKMQEQMTTMQREMEALKAQQQQEREEANKKQAESLQQVQTAQEEFREKTPSLLERVKLGGYGFTRFEANLLNQLHNTFTLRRLELTTDAKTAPRLWFSPELEYERFRKLELERSARPENEGLEVEQAIEGTDGSEIAIKQAWLQYDLTKWLSIRTGAVLVPLGRFNLRHDNNFAQFFFTQSGGETNAALPAGDPVLDTTQTTGDPFPGPFVGQSMKCCQCHFVDEHTTTPGAPAGGVRAYADFARCSPMPQREDGKLTTPRNSPPLVNASLSQEGRRFFSL